MQYPYLRTDVFQGFREIGNAILLCLQLEGFLVSNCAQSLADVFVKLVANAMSLQATSLGKIPVKHGELKVTVF